MEKEHLYTMTIKIAQGGTEHIQDDEISKSTAGHMWYTLAKDGEQTDSYGFIPENKGITDLWGLWTKGDIATNDDKAYQASYATYEVRITKEQYDKLVDFGDKENLEANDFGKIYDVPSNSCVDYVWKAMEFAGVNPDKFDGDVFPGNNRDDVNKHLYKAINGTEIPKEEQALEESATDGSFTAIYGSNHADVLTSTKEAEVVYGGRGDDTLNGVAGHADKLRGGKDFDTYKVQENDSIKDSDGRGQIYFNASLLSGVKHKVSEGVYEDTMFTYTTKDNTLIIAQKEDTSKSITIENWQSQKALDIELCDDMAETIQDEDLIIDATSLDMSKVTIIQKSQEEPFDTSSKADEILRQTFPHMYPSQTQEENTSTYNNSLPDSMNEYLDQFKSQGNAYDNEIEL